MCRARRGDHDRRFIIHRIVFVVRRVAITVRQDVSETRKPIAGKSAHLTRAERG
jgi:hypothetical protein